MPVIKQMKELEMQFHKDMLSIYENAKKIGYNATRFRQMVANEGGYNVAKKFINNNKPSEGFTSLWELGRLDLTVESLVLQDEYRELFSEVEKETVKKRLQDYGFELKAPEAEDKSFIVPVLEPVKRSREYQIYNELVRSNVVYEYIFNSRTHRWIDENIMGLNPAESRGYQAMGILHHIGLKEKHKGIFNGYDIQVAVGILQHQHTDFQMVIDCLELLNNIEEKQTNDFNKEFNLSLFHKGLDNQEYILGNETKYYILTVKIVDIEDSLQTIITYLVYLLENRKVIERREVRSETYKNILTDAKKEGVMLLYQLNPNVTLEDVTMVHYKQDRPNANPWQKDSYEVLSGLVVEYLEELNSSLIKTVGDDVDSEKSEEDEYHKEGATTYFNGKRYERNPKNRAKAIEIHGLNCKGCGFNFEKVYGERGKDFIEIHHVNPLSTIQEEVAINPETDLIPVCSNCHRMIHRKKDEVLTIEELRELMKN